MSPILDHLRYHGERVAVLTGTQQLSYHQLADAVADTAQELGGPRRLVLLETRNDSTTLVCYLAAMARGHVVLPVAAGRDHTTIAQTYEPDIVIDGNGIHHRHRGGRHRLHDDLALLLSTSGSTGSPKLVRLSAGNLASKRRRHRRIPRHPRNGQGRNHPADVVLLRPVRAPQPPAARRGPDPHRSLGRRRRVLGTIPPAPGHLVRRCALHLRAARARRRSGFGPTASAIRHPGRRPDVTRACAPIRRAGPTSRLGPVRDVRRDGGHRPNGLSPTGTRLIAPRRDRQPDTWRIVHYRTMRRVERRRRRGAGVPRTQRDDGLRAPARRLGARQDGRRAAYRRHRPTAPRWAVRSDRAQQPVRQDVRAANRPATRRGGHA